MASKPPTKKQREAAAAKLKREMDAIQKASTHIEEAVNILRGFEEITYTRDRLLDAIKTCGTMYGVRNGLRAAVLAGERDPP